MPAERDSAQRGGYNTVPVRCVERSLAVCAEPDDKEAARTGCPLGNLTNGEIQNLFFRPTYQNRPLIVVNDSS